MRKHFLYPRWKNLLYAPLFLLLIVSTALTGVSATPGPANIFVDPPTVTIEAVGENVTIAINVTDVIDYYGCDFWLYYNETLLEKVAITVDGPGQVAPTDPSKRSIGDNSVPGTVKFSGTFVYATGATPFTGNGTVAWITFKGLMVGVSNLNFDATWTVWYYAPALPEIPTEETFTELLSGEIEVIPEFPAAIATPLLLIATLAAALLAKIVWSRKRRGPATA